MDELQMIGSELFVLPQKQHEYYFMYHAGDCIWSGCMFEKADMFLFQPLDGGATPDTKKKETNWKKEKKWVTGTH